LKIRQTRERVLDLGARDARRQHRNPRTAGRSDVSTLATLALLDITSRMARSPLVREVVACVRSYKTSMSPLLSAAPKGGGLSSLTPAKRRYLGAWLRGEVSDLTALRRDG
jgi:hypothetical protein